MFYYRHEAVDTFLDRSRLVKNPTSRILSSEDMQLSMDILNLYGDCNTAISQLLLIMAVIRKMDDPDLDYIVRNFRRMLNSLIKQRNKGYAIKCALKIIKAKPEEIESVKRYIRTTRERFQYIESFVIPENLKLTPIQEYLDIIGTKTLHEDICREFPTRMSMVQANNGEDPESLERYANKIIETVRAFNKEQDYKVRLREYMTIADRHIEQIESEKTAERNAEKLDKAREAMMGFHRMFNRAVTEFRSDSRINMGRQVIVRWLEEYGRDIYFILCCYPFGNKMIYRYVGEKGLVPNFGGSKIFRTKEEAEEAAQKCQAECPDKLFDTIQFSHIEDE